MLPDRQRGNSLRERVPEVRVLGAAAVAGVPSGVNGKLHQVGEPTKLIRSCCLAAGQGTELLEVGRCGSMGDQVVVEPNFVCQLILGVVADVLRHIAVQRQQVL